MILKLDRVSIANLRDWLRLVAVTDDRVLGSRDPVAVCMAAVRGGATAIQLRLQQAQPRDLARIAERLLARVDVPVLINDRLDVALAVKAHGVHLGAGDIPMARAKAIVPAGFVVGASVGDSEEAAAGADAHYWGIGPWRESVTKDDAGPPLGPEGFRRLVELAGGRPCIAIGGVRPEDVAHVLGAGGIGVAVVSGIFGADDVEAAARRYVQGQDEQDRRPPPTR